MTDYDTAEYVMKLERQREVLLNAIAEAVRIITGRIPDTRDITKRFLEDGALPIMAREEETDAYPLREASYL